MPLLSWFNRDADLTRAALAPYRLLEPVAELSHGEPDSPNMLIEGDRRIISSGSIDGRPIGL